MIFLEFVFLLLSFLFAFINIFYKKKSVEVFTLLSFAFWGFTLLLSDYDMEKRLLTNDLSGVMDIFPSMTSFFAITLTILIVLNTFVIYRKYKLKSSSQ